MQSMQESIHLALKELVKDKYPFAVYPSVDRSQWLSVYSCHQIDDIYNESWTTYESDKIYRIMDNEGHEAYFYESYYHQDDYDNEIFKNGMGASTSEYLPKVLREQIQRDGEPQNIDVFMGKGFFCDCEKGTAITIHQFHSNVNKYMLRERHITWGGCSISQGKQWLDRILPKFTCSYDRFATESQYNSSIIDPIRDFSQAIETALLQGYSVQCFNDEYTLTNGENQIRWSNNNGEFLPHEIEVNGERVERINWVNQQLEQFNRGSVGYSTLDIEPALLDLVNNINRNNLARVFHPGYSNCNIMYNLDQTDGTIHFKFKHETTQETKITYEVNEDSVKGSESIVSVSIPAVRCYPERYHYEILRELSKEKEIEGSGMNVLDNTLEFEMPLEAIPESNEYDQKMKNENEYDQEMKYIEYVMPLETINSYDNKSYDDEYDIEQDY